MAGEAKPDVGSMLSGILSNPQALSSIMSIIGGLKSNGSPIAEQGDTPSPVSEDIHALESSVTPKVDALPVFSPNAPSGDAPSFMPYTSEKSRERELLLALKPFLSARRCETIDTFVRLLDIVSLLGRVR